MCFSKKKRTKWQTVPSSANTMYIFTHTQKVNTEPMCTGRAIKDIVLWASDFACFCCFLRNNKAKTQQVRK